MPKACFDLFCFYIVFGGQLIAFKQSAVEIIFNASHRAALFYGGVQKAFGYYFTLYAFAFVRAQKNRLGIAANRVYDVGSSADARDFEVDFLRRICRDI